MKTSQVVITSLSLLGAGALGYAIYFDYKRQTDANFRKSLKKDSKKTSKASKKDAERRAKAEDAIIEQVLAEIRAPGALPIDTEDKEQYFLQHVSLGEQLFAQGSEHYLDASIAFFKALKSYPAPVELIMIYQKAVPKEVFDCIMRIVSKDIAMGGGGEAGPSAGAAGLGGAGITNLDDVDEDGPSGAAAEVHAAQKAKQAEGEDDEETTGSGAAAKEGSATAPASTTTASSQQGQQNNGTDSGTTSSQEWDSLSANSLNDTGVIVPPGQAAGSQTPSAAAVSEADESASVDTAEAVAPQVESVEESATPVVEAETPAVASVETSYEKTEDELVAPVDTVASDEDDQWEDEEKKESN